MSFMLWIPLYAIGGSTVIKFEDIAIVAETKHAVEKIEEIAEIAAPTKRKVGRPRKTDQTTDSKPGTLSQNPKLIRINQNAKPK